MRFRPAICHADFNPRLPRGRRPRPSAIWSRRRYFNPRLPRGRRLCSCGEVRSFRHISIHASLAGGDWQIKALKIKAAEFQSTPPSREATRGGNTMAMANVFQSTPPSREAT